MVVSKTVFASSRYLPVTSAPSTVTSEIFPWSASLRSWVRLIFFSCVPPVVLTTTCHRKTRQVIMKTQIRICLTVEFKANFLIFRLQRPRNRMALVRPGWRSLLQYDSLQLLDDIY